MKRDQEGLGTPLIEGLRVTACPRFEDARGTFDELHPIAEGGSPPQAKFDAAEVNLSSSRQGTLRGLHGDRLTTKRVQCVAGRLFLAVVDLRQRSGSYGQWQAWTLNADAEQRLQVHIPLGCVNGHYALSDCALLYLQDQRYAGAAAQISLRWNDPTIGIEWPAAPSILSERDEHAPFLATPVTSPAGSE